MEIVGWIGDCIKADEKGVVSGYLVRYGNPSTTDLEGDYFTKQTDFGFPTDVKVPLNLYYHHGMNREIGKRPIGKGYLTADDKGLWYQAQIDMADEYGKMVADLAKSGKLGYSSGAASHMVERKQIGNAHEITRWLIAEASLTPTPAEPQNMVKSLAELMPQVKSEGDDMESEIEIPDVVGNPASWAESVFTGSREFIFHESLEQLYEIMCAALYTVGEQPGPLPEYINAVVDAFGTRVKELAANMDEKSLKSSTRQIPHTIRLTEHRLRDVFGFSRSSAKKLAALVFENLRDTDTETKSLDDEPPADDSVERVQLQIVLRDRLK
jgi:phage head maturation protease